MHPILCVTGRYRHRSRQVTCNIFRILIGTISNLAESDTIVANTIEHYYCSKHILDAEFDTIVADIIEHYQQSEATDQPTRLSLRQRVFGFLVPCRVQRIPNTSLSLSMCSVSEGPCCLRPKVFRFSVPFRVQRILNTSSSLAMCSASGGPCLKRQRQELSKRLQRRRV